MRSPAIVLRAVARHAALLLAAAAPAVFVWAMSVTVIVMGGLFSPELQQAGTEYVESLSPWGFPVTIRAAALLSTAVLYAASLWQSRTDPLHAAGPSTAVRRRWLAMACASIPFALLYIVIVLTTMTFQAVPLWFRPGASVTNAPYLYIIVLVVLSGTGYVLFKLFTAWCGFTDHNERPGHADEERSQAATP